MKRVAGIGGIFFKSDDPNRLYEWYERHLGMQRTEQLQAVVFASGDPENPDAKGVTLWSLFPRDTTYFKDSRSPFMINYRVDDLDGLLAELEKEGVSIDPDRQDFDFGRFAWITDPEGNRIELWEAPKK
jgi:predicted enzyme related to lactoylglutathione lyase